MEGSKLAAAILGEVRRAWWQGEVLAKVLLAILAGATMTMTGGTITGNEVDTAGGGVYLAEGGTLELGGPAAINGNTVSSADNNLYLPTTGATWAQIEAATGEIGVTMVRQTIT